jgi:hypothetical protein
MTKDEIQWSPKMLLLRQALDRLRQCAEGKLEQACFEEDEASEMCTYIHWLACQYASRLKWGDLGQGENDEKR